MTNEHNFKVGDRVRYIGECRCYVETDIDPKDTYAVKSVEDDEVVIDVPSEAVIWEHNLELVKPNDRKTDFLQRLQSLLREYDAFLVAHKTDMPVSLYFNDNEDDIPSASIGKEINKGCGVIITANNVMNFDKE